MEENVGKLLENGRTFALHAHVHFCDVAIVTSGARADISRLSSDGSVIDLNRFEMPFLGKRTCVPVKENLPSHTVLFTIMYLKKPSCKCNDYTYT